MAINREHILDVKREFPFVPIPEKHAGEGTDETGDAWATSGKSVVKERSSAELLRMYLRSLGGCRRKKQRRNLSRELGRIRLSPVES